MLLDMRAKLDPVLVGSVVVLVDILAGLCGACKLLHVCKWLLQLLLQCPVFKGKVVELFMQCLVCFCQCLECSAFGVIGCGKFLDGVC